MRALAVIDGEHYRSVVRDALIEVPYDVVAAVLVGGTEKLRSGDAIAEDYGVPVLASLEQAIADYAPEVVLDLSDEPVLGPPARFALAARALVLGVPYEGADFRLEPPQFAPVGVPSIAVIGTGKRVGKTAVTGHVARMLARERHVIVVAMGRGGPVEPELVGTQPSVADLIALSHAGRHAASDHLETAALIGLPTIGCRRCGGGLAGTVFTSNVLEGVELAETLDPELIVLDGSGAAIPPVAADRTILVVGGHQDAAVATGYLNPYRALLSDLVVVAMAEERVAHEALAAAMSRLVRPGIPVVRAVLRPRPLDDVRGRRIAFFGTAPPAQHESIAAHLGDTHGAIVVHVSGNLSDRSALREELRHVDAEVFVVEVKAAAIDVVAAEAARIGVPVVLAANDVIPRDGEPDFDGIVERLAREAVASATVSV